MPGIGNTNVSMDSIATELTIGGGSFGNNNLKAVLFATSSTAGNSDSGSFHNYNNMTILANKPFANAIHSPYNTGTNMKLSNWIGYYHDSNHITSLIINNGNNFNNVDVRVWISDNTGPGGIQIYNGTVPRQNIANVSMIDYNTTVGAYSTFTNGYYVVAELVINGGVPIVTNVSITSVDVDNVGAGTARYTFTDANGVWDLDSQGAITAQWIVAANGSPDPIAWNKRTSTIIDIT